MEYRAILTQPLKAFDEDKNGFFTEEKFKEWYNLLLDFTLESIDELMSLTGAINGFTYELNKTLLREVIYDAMIGLKTIVVSKHNTVHQPNPFKIAAYLGYWFLRHKPILFRAESDLKLETLKFNLDEDDEDDRNAIIFEMKHLNEVTVARFILRYIFNLNGKPMCDNKTCKRIKKCGNFCFDDFSDMFMTLFYKLVYHLCYRELSPKIIEHFLEAYTLHPHLPCTNDLWGPGENDQTHEK